MSPRLQRILFPLLAALLSGTATWLVCRTDRQTAAPGASHQAPPSAAVPLPAALRPSLASSSAAAFLAALRTTDAAALRQAWLENPDLPRRQAVIARWAALAPQDCWQFLCARGTGRAFDPVLASLHLPLLYDVWVRSDPAAARDALIRQQRHEGVEGGFALSRLVKASALAGGKAWSGLLQDPRFAGYISTHWGQIAEGGCLRPDTAERLQLLASYDAALSLGLRDFADACTSENLPAEVTAAEALEQYAALSPEARQKYGETLGRRLAAEDTADGAALLAALPREERRAAASGFAKALAAQDAAASWQWINAELDTGRSEAATGWANVVPPEEAARILQTAEPSPLTDAAVRTVAGRMARNDPGKAAAWARTLPDPVSRRTAWREAAAAWAVSDPHAAIPALTAPDAPPLTNDLYRAVASRLAEKDPELARDFIRRLPPERAAFAGKGPPEKKEP